ncbi:MAG: hypothetical protein QNK37_24065 [Acidobacteriota bacterium]|nr:hypothetical protein [Acidobacteriota bacterium]
MQSTEMIVEQLFKSAVLPVIAGGAGAFLSSRILPDRLRGDGAAAVGMLAGFAVSFYAVAGFGGFPPVRVDQWVPFLGLAAVILFAIAGHKNTAIRGILHLVLMAGVLWIFYKPLGRLYNTWEMIMWIGGSIAVWAALWLSWEGVEESERHKELFLAMVVTATGISLVSVMDGSALIGQVSGALAASCGGLFLASLFLPGLRIGPTGAAVFITLTVGLLLNTYHYVEVHAVASVLALSAGFAINILRLPFLREAGLIKRSVVVCAVGLAPIVAAVVFLLTGAPPEDEYDYGY